VVELLLEYGADLNMNIDRGALTIACHIGDLTMAEYLLSHGADPRLRNLILGGRYPLYDPARTGDLQIIDLLLAHGADRNIQDGDVFAIAACGGQKTITRLLDLELSPAERQKYLDRSLQKAAYFTDLNLCSWLLEQGADSNYSPGEYGCPLKAADINNRLLIINLLLRHGASPNTSALHTALIDGQSKSAKALLDAGADVNICGGEVHSPLQAAARYTPKLLPRLLASGADVNAVGGIYGTALHVAAYTHDIESIKLLLSHGAEVTIIAGKYSSVIQAAAREDDVANGTFTLERQSVEATELLYEHGASATVQGGKYGSALQMAAKSRNLLTLKWLLAHGADPHAEGGKYGIALKAAVKKERYAVISYLSSIMEDKIEVCIFNSALAQDGISNLREQLPM
jgi:ankyrin repeat protein